uniref:Adhesion G-protein coupled receptor G2 n=1 Tax=Latimeria chalumnae TaxID=7897 RepID=H3AFI5_LATCH
TISKTGNLSAAEVDQIITKMDEILSVANVDSEIAGTMVNIVSNVLNNSDATMASYSRRKTIIQIVNQISLKLNFTTQSVNLTSPSLALAVTKINSSSFHGISFGIRDSSGLQVSLEDQVPENSVGSITLPSSILTNLTMNNQDLASRIQFNFYKNPILFQDTSESFYLNSFVISSSVGNLTIGNLKENITITLKNKKDIPSNTKVICAFWDFTKNSGRGGWNKDGCILENTTAIETVCKCNHLTSFGILLDPFRNDFIDPGQNVILTFISYIGCGISSIFLSVTLVTYIVLEKVRRDYPSKILINLCTALLFLNLVFLIDPWIALYDRVPGLCIAVAVFLHYFLLASFTWMGLEAFHMYLALVKVFNTYVHRYALKFCIVGWGVPAIVVIIVIVIQRENYGLISYGKSNTTADDLFFSCWIKNDITFYVSVVAYYCLIFLLNISMFIVVLTQLCRIKNKRQLGSPQKSTLRDLRSVAGLTFLLGITWGFAFFAWGPVNLPFLYLFAIFNSLQGFFIFVFHCALKENVQKQWRQYLCCGKFRLAENSDWSRTATNTKRQSVVPATLLSANSTSSLQSNTNSITLLVKSDYFTSPSGNGTLWNDVNALPYSEENGDVQHNISNKNFSRKKEAKQSYKQPSVSLKRTTHKHGNICSEDKM